MSEEKNNNHIRYGIISNVCQAGLVLCLNIYPAPNHVEFVPNHSPELQELHEGVLDFDTGTSATTIASGTAQAWAPEISIGFSI